MLFAAGLVVAVLVWLRPETHVWFESLHRLGYVGALVGGAMYGLSLTAGAATIVFATLPPALSPWLAAVVGGIGALLYDLFVFALVRHEGQGRIKAFLARHRHPQAVPRWLLVALGCLIFASPLPDELAAGLFGLSSLSISRFILLSFALNTGGLFLITLIG